VGEAVPVTVWPLPSTSNSRAQEGVRDGIERTPVDAVVQRVLACYPTPAARLVIDRDSSASPDPLENADRRLLDLVVVVCRAKTDTHPWALRSRLAPGGLLVIVLPPTVTVDLAAVVTAARAAGLCYLQHNVVFPIPPAGRGPRVALSRVCARARGHARIHTDVLVFAGPGRGPAAGVGVGQRADQCPQPAAGPVRAGVDQAPGEDAARAGHPGGRRVQRTR
jgi:hypothetical protein